MRCGFNRQAWGPYKRGKYARVSLFVRTQSRGYVNISEEAAAYKPREEPQKEPYLAGTFSPVLRLPSLQTCEK